MNTSERSQARDKLARALLEHGRLEKENAHLRHDNQRLTEINERLEARLGEIRESPDTKGLRAKITELHREVLKWQRKWNAEKAA